MNFRVHFYLENEKHTADVNAVNAEAAAKQIRKTYEGAVIQKTKVLKEAA